MPNASPPPVPAIRPETYAVGGDQFRQALARFPTGVVILSTIGPDARKVGLTVSSFNSISLTPPLVLWALARTAPSFPAFRQAAHFSVNVLSEAQADLARHFARPAPDKFAAIRHALHDTEVPIIEECAAYLVCRTWSHYDGGDHLIIVGEVIDLGISGHAPLVFGLGQFGRLVLDLADTT